MEALLMRNPCPRCDHRTGRIETRNGQDCVFCQQCGAFQYNAPKTETGRAERTVTTVHNGIKPKQRARVLFRANGACEVCGAIPGPDVQLHVGHVISVNDGLRHGYAEADLNNDENLIASCGECNLGMGSETMPIRMFMRILWVRTRRAKTAEREGSDADE